MKKLISIQVIGLIISIVLLSCSKNNNDKKEVEEKKDEWVQIDSIMPNAIISKQLDSVFSNKIILENDNNCLLNFQKDTVLYTVFNREGLLKLDTCNNIPDIEFEKYTLFVGKVLVSSISDKLSTIFLTSNAAKSTYKYEISIDTCESCWTAQGYKYFWRLYPKLHSGYKVISSIHKK